MRATFESWVTTTRSVFIKAGPERDTGLMLVKAVVATVVAWKFAVYVLDSPTPFYAPMAALLVVDRTLFRSMWGSAQRVLAVSVGMGAAWLVGSVVGVSWWSMAPVIFFALLIARWRRFGDYGIQVPTMVLLSLLTVGGTSADFTYLTLVETFAGGLIGVATNALMFSPLHVTAPREAVSVLTRQAHDLLTEMAKGIRDEWDEATARAWYERSAVILARAPKVKEEVALGHESTRFNVRTRLSPVNINWDGYTQAVESLRLAQWHISGIARSLIDAADDDDPQPRPSDDVMETFADALDEIAKAMTHFGHDGDGEVEIVDEGLDAATTVLDGLQDKIRNDPSADPSLWPSIGALIVDAKRIIRQLAATRSKAAVPTDSGPVRKPMLGL